MKREAERARKDAAVRAAKKEARRLQRERERRERGIPVPVPPPPPPLAPPVPCLLCACLDVPFVRCAPAAPRGRSVADGQLCDCASMAIRCQFTGFTVPPASQAAL